MAEVTSLPVTMGNLTILGSPGLSIDVTDPGFITNILVGIMLFLLTFSGQIFVFIVVASDARLRDEGNLYIASLAMADILLSLFSMTTWTFYSSVLIWPFPQWMCDMWLAFDVCMSFVSVNIICFIAFDRFLCLKFPFTYPLKRTKNIAIAIQVFLWGFTISVQTTFIIATQHIYGRERDLNDCQLHFQQNPPLTLLYIGVSLYLPILLTIIIYLEIYRMARKVSTSVKVGQIQSSTSGNVTHGNGTMAAQATNKKDNSKALKTLGLLLVTYVVCWSPVGMALIVNSYTPGRISPYFIIFGYWMGYANSTINPICYAIGNPHFRQTLKKKVLGRCATNKTEDDTSTSTTT